MKTVSKTIAVLSLSLFTSVALANPKDVPQQETAPIRSSILGSAYQNLQDLMPFLFTTAISVVMGKMQPKEAELRGNAGLAFLLQHAAIAIPAAVSMANAYGRVATIRDTRKSFDENDVDNQNALTRQQDEVIANYAVTVPASIFAASRLATSQDAAARIGYIVGSYLIASGDNSPFAHIKSFVANGIDSLRLKKEQSKE